ncbi:MAG: tryptophan synthase subunit alpha [Deferrisomatales bacterium]|nr:tryptophan synthase subunit alpha [Deferrisomatales bacterium]
MSRLEETLRAARDRGRKLLVPFFTGEYPDRGTFRLLLLEAQAAGADALEVGIPFSDPAADGPVIQQASAAALAGGASVRRLLEDLAWARSRGLSVPVLFMTYFNPVLAFGPEAFAREARAAGADGVLVVDLPPEESAELVPAARAQGLDTVFLVAPTTPEARIPKIAAVCRGFVYCVAVTGVTGEKRPAAEAVAGLVERVRRHTDLPALVGFGVSGPDAARALAAAADGVIVGSALLETLGGERREPAAHAAGLFLRDMRAALDGGPAPRPG